MLAFSVLDSVCCKLKEYQTEIISEDFYMKLDTNKFNSREQLRIGKRRMAWEMLSIKLKSPISSKSINIGLRYLLAIILLRTISPLLLE